jgi:hypothetical protein
MSDPIAILRTKKHKSVGNLRGRESHTYRTRETPNADPARKDQNKLLCGRLDYANFAQEKLDEYRESGKTIRKDAVIAIEYLLTASPEFFKEKSRAQREGKLKSWCDKQIEYLKKKHGAENILCAYLHMDETTPHIEVYVLPIDPNGKLNCKHFLGGPAKMSQLQTEYADANKILGLVRGVEGSRANHRKIKQLYGDIERKTPVTGPEVDKATTVNPPTPFDLINLKAYAEKESKRISGEVKKLFSDVVKLANLTLKSRNFEQELIKAQEKFTWEQYEMDKTDQEELKRLRGLQKSFEDGLNEIELLREENQLLRRELNQYQINEPKNKMKPKISPGNFPS